MLANKQQIINKAKESSADSDEWKQLYDSDEKYQRIMKNDWAIIKNVIIIDQSENIHYLFEDADFSLERVRKLMEDRELNAAEAMRPSKLSRATFAA